MWWRRGFKIHSQSELITNPFDGMPSPWEYKPMSSSKHTLAFFLLVAALILSVSPAFAGASNKSGNPFGNGSFFPDSGNFSAILRGSGGFIGTVQFSTTAGAVTSGSSSNSANITQTGFATVYTPGFITNLTVAGTNNTTTGVQTTNTLSQANIIGTQWQGPAFGVVTGSQIAVTYALGTVTSQIVNQNSAAITASVLSITNLNGGGNFTAQLKNSYPVQTFSGQGLCTVQPAATQVQLGTNSSPVTTSMPLAVTINFTNSVTGQRLVQTTQ